MGLTCHYYDHSRNQLMCVLLACRKIPHPHTAATIFDLYTKLVDEWGITNDRILRILTDNGSNVVSAFKECICTLVEQKSPPDSSLVVPAISEYDQNLEDSFIEDFDEQEILEYERNEIDLENAFYRLKQLSCFTHNLMLAAKAAVDDTNAAKETQKKALALIASVCKSSKAVEMLKNRTGGIGLVKPVRTRWIYWYFVFDRLLSIKRPLCDTCEELGIIHDLNPADWELLSKMRDIFAPFAMAVTRLEGEHYATISEVYPVLFSLNDKLKKYESRLVRNLDLVNQPEINQIESLVLPMVRRLKRNLDFRFSRIYSPTSFNFDPLYMLATYLDPRYALFLEGQLLEVAKRELKLMAHNDGPAPSMVPEQVLIENEANRFDSEDLLASVRAKISERRRSANSHILGDGCSFDVEQSVYISEAKNVDATTDPFLFWSERKERLPLMYNIAVDVLAVPATTAPVERVFSRASYILAKKRHNLLDEKLEIELLCKFNLELAL